MQRLKILRSTVELIHSQYAVVRRVRGSRVYIKIKRPSMVVEIPTRARRWHPKNCDTIARTEAVEETIQMCWQTIRVKDGEGL